MVFGYFNRNWEEQPVIPIGPNNSIEPGGPDQGQPTLFFPRRNKFVFRVRVPKDFGNKEVVWTLTVHGKTERAYGTLKPDYKLDLRIIQANMTCRWASTIRTSRRTCPPVVRLDGDTRRTVKVEEPLALTAVVTDDGVSNRCRRRRAATRTRPRWVCASRGSSTGVRGTGSRSTRAVQGVPGQEATAGTHHGHRDGRRRPSPDGKFPVTVTFGAPGTYVVRVLAHDGGLDTTKDVIVTVLPVSSSAAR